MRFLQEDGSVAHWTWFTPVFSWCLPQQWAHEFLLLRKCIFQLGTQHMRSSLKCLEHCAVLAMLVEYFVVEKDYSIQNPKCRGNVYYKIVTDLETVSHRGNASNDFSKGSRWKVCNTTIILNKVMMLSRIHQKYHKKIRSGCTKFLWSISSLIQETSLQKEIKSV